MNNETLVNANEVYRYYGDHCAVENLSFTVNRGEVLGFLGPNGAGKSTTMQILCGVLSPSSGQVTIAGIDMQEQPKQAKQHLGFLPELPPLYIDMTVDEYLKYAAGLRGMRKTDIPDTIARSKQRCGLEKVGSRIIRNLSKGYRQRVGIAQAIIHSPAVIVLDEPTSGLDPIQIREIRDMIRELGNDHSIILSTHILSEVQSVCDRALIINNGKLVFDHTISGLNEVGRLVRISVGYKSPPTIDSLVQIEGVNDVEKLDDQHYLIEIDPAKNVMDAIMRQALEQNCGLHSIVPQSDSLEEIFVRLANNNIPAADEAVPENR